MSSSSKWKSKLVSSSFPLEFEVAKKLVKHGFSITADYVYARNDSGVIKDFSVDLEANAYLPFSNPNSINSQLSLLVECKQRHQNVKWLFFPDPNRPDFSPFTLGCTIRAIDEFSRKFFKANTTVEFDIDVPCCYKGVEIDEGNSNRSDQQKENDNQKDTSRVYDSELKHGVSQLQYALPRLLSDSILINFSECPFLICPILLTTSEIFVARQDLTVKSVNSANSLFDLAKSTPYVILYSDYGPDFERHCVDEWMRLEQINKEQLGELDAYRYKHGEYNFNLPSSILESLIRGGGGYFKHHFFTQFIVCQFDHFDALLNAIKKIAAKSNRTLRKSRKL